ncbi:MAG: beta-lactamase family protein [Microbacteriaceae bacterium]|nr:beta-lactamase family protein [Microbacteriaceae bacterium]
MRRGLAVVALGVSVVLLAACSAGSGGGATVEAIGSHTDPRMPAAVATQLQAVLANAVKLSGATGGVAGVWAPWAGTWTTATGTVSNEKGAPAVVADASFRIGSLTKPLSCTVLLDLAAAHKVGLEDEVSKYLPRMVGINGLRLGDLCRNTSGLGDYWASLTPQLVTNPTRPWEALELVNSAMGSSGATSAAAKWEYSNAGFVLLGMALQAATNTSWSQLYATYVTAPLGIADTTTYPSSGKLPSPTMSTYAPDRNVVTGALDCKVTDDESRLSPSALQQAGGIVSNLDDTASLAHAVAAGTLLRSKTDAAEQQKAAPMSASMPSWAGYGLGVEKMGPLIGHASAVPGTLTAAYSDPASGLTVVIMVNDSGPGANFARLAALQLASIGSKAPARAGQKAPNISLPWSASQLAQVLPHEAGCNAAKGALTNAGLKAIAAIQPSY